MEKVRRQLSTEAFAAFREDSGAFMRGALTAGELHQRVAALGAAAEVPQLAALCPDADKRAQLLEAHRCAPSAALHDEYGACRCHNSEERPKSLSTEPELSVEIRAPICELQFACAHTKSHRNLQAPGSGLWGHRR